MSTAAGPIEIPGADPRLAELVGRLGEEAGCVAYAEELRWPAGVICPRCASERIGYLATRRKHSCRECRYQFRVTAGTVLHDSHLPLYRWLRAVALIIDSERGFPARQLQASIGGSYKTAWFVEHRIRSAMSRALQSPVASAALERSPTRPGRRAGTGSAGETPRPAAQEPSARSGWKLVRRLASAYHRPNLAYLDAYWSEIIWRDRHLDDEHAFRMTVKALLDAEPLPYERLIGRKPLRRRSLSASVAAPARASGWPR